MSRTFKLALAVATVAVVPGGLMAPGPAHADPVCTPPAMIGRVCVEASRGSGDDVFVDGEAVLIGPPVIPFGAHAGLNDSGKPWVSVNAGPPDRAVGASFYQTDYSELGFSLTATALARYKLSMGLTVTDDDPPSQSSLCLASADPTLPPKTCVIGS